MSDLTVNEQIVSEYKNLASNSKESEWKFARMLNASPVSERVKVASVKRAREFGDAPSFKEGHVQQVGLTLLILDKIEGAKEAPFAKVLTLASRIYKGMDSGEGRKEQAVEYVEQAIKEKLSFSSLQESAPASNKKEQGNTFSATPSTLFDIATVARERLESIIEGMGDNLIVTGADIAALKALAIKCQALAKIEPVALTPAA